MDLSRIARVAHEGTVVREGPRDSVALFDEGVGVLLSHKPGQAGPPQVAHYDQRLPRRTFDVELRNLPRGAVVLGRVRRAARVADMHLERAVLEAGEPPAVLVSPLIGCPDGTHTLRRKVRKLLEQVVVDGSATHHPYHPAHCAAIRAGLYESGVRHRRVGSAGHALPRTKSSGGNLARRAPPPPAMNRNAFPGAPSLRRSASAVTQPVVGDQVPLVALPTSPLPFQTF